MNAVGTEWVTPGLPRMWVYAIVNNLGYNPIFFIDRSRAVLLLWTICVISVLFCYASCTSVCWCLLATCLERADLSALVCDILLWRCHFLIGILGQVWCLIVSIPDLCPLLIFITLVSPVIARRWVRPETQWQPWHNTIISHWTTIISLLCYIWYVMKHPCKLK